ncbi:L-aspartate oxidase [Blastococcus saxobsidens]|uniref:L-aspartate oxidase n=1 Tax=Blastococcus saxobsidens (strain DD2) TaxID=1146883 RepID=H6RIP9_BLASD|nr:L-aspartate oxidase [Blastococcus saxobsidens]CCG02243.1 L-aspartate oxidase (Quinolinate synthetase B) [Blastococcus saxobsidens DD2]
MTVGPRRTAPVAPAVVPALPLPAAGWSTDVDAIVVGSGAAGLMTALALAEAGRRVTVVTKGALGDGSTRWAQGGLAAVLGADDDAELHLQDTLTAGAGLCDEAAVATLVTEAPAAIGLLQDLGARLDLDPHGRPALTREGGHSRDRIVHAGGDASGAEVTRTLTEALRSAGIEVLEQTVALEALRGRLGEVVGLRVARVAVDGTLTDAGDLRAHAVVLATGGYGQAYAAATSPAGTTGDGLALALRAGAEVADVEMVQFHPTVLWQGPGATGQQALISEAVRGEGAVLVDGDGRRIMPGAHPLADLAPRDVVSATIAAHLAATGADFVFLDATGLGADFLENRFPGILRACRAAGFDPATEPVPVAPGAHYTCGGVLADLDGRTGVPGLFAVGEVACTGVHGANRLASNSVTEGLVAARRCAAVVDAELPPGAPAEPARTSSFAGGAIDPAARPGVSAATSRYAGVVRTADGLAELTTTLARADRLPAGRPLDLAAVEATAVHTVATLLATAALARPESRGCHRRADAPGPRPEWQVRLAHRIDVSGHLHTRTVPLTAPRTDQKQGVA